MKLSMKLKLASALLLLSTWQVLASEPDALSFLEYLADYENEGDIFDPIDLNLAINDKASDNTIFDNKTTSQATSKTIATEKGAKREN